MPFMIEWIPSLNLSHIIVPAFVFGFKQLLSLFKNQFDIFAKSKGKPTVHNLPVWIFLSIKLFTLYILMKSFNFASEKMLFVKVNWMFCLDENMSTLNLLGFLTI